jgi:hypothetical protein
MKLALRVAWPFFGTTPVSQLVLDLVLECHVLVQLVIGPHCVLQC